MKWKLAPNDRWLRRGRERQVFRKWTTVLIDYDAAVPQDIAERADALFERLKPHLTRSKMAEKQADWRQIYAAIETASRREKCAVIFPRNTNHKDFKTIRIQVMDAAVAEQVVEPYKAKKGSLRTSRYVPKMERPRIWVEVRDRETKEPIPFNWRHPVALETQSKLEIVNRTNGSWKITIEPFDFSLGEYGARIPIHPVHVAKFTNDFSLHGRIYASHQQYESEARKTIRFGNARSVELDYGGFHPRALYHLEGIRYPGDPYELWGDDTTREMRLMAKQVINAALNADSRESAISACNFAMGLKTKQGKWKEGKKLRRAIALKDAVQRTGLKFADIYDLALSFHRRISHCFGADVGIKLMRMDSRIALRVLYHFANQAYPCLGVHDSFVVPETQEDELRRVMIAFYRIETRFEPVIK